MILKWSKDETLKNLESLQKYIDKNRYYDENILNSIDFYNSILNDDDIFLEEEEPFIKKGLIKKLKNLSFLYKKALNNMPSYEKKMLINMVEELGSSFINPYAKPFKEVMPSDNTLYETSLEVAEKIDKDLVKYLDYIYKNKLVNVDRQNIETSYCNIDVYNKKGYVYASPNNQSSMFSILNHELGHSVSNITNGYNIYYNLPSVAEFYSIYMQIFTDKYLYDKTHDNKYLISYYNYMMAYRQSILGLAVLNHIANLDNINKDSVREMLYENYKVEPSNFRNYLERFILMFDYYTTEENIGYLFSFCSSIKVLNDGDNKLYKKALNEDIDSVSKFYNTLGIDIKNSELFLEIFCKENEKLEKLIRKRNTAK